MNGEDPKISISQTYTTMQRPEPLKFTRLTPIIDWNPLHTTSRLDDGQPYLPGFQIA